MKKYILFDLDGTLTDPKAGITASVQYALHSFGIEEPDLNKLEPFIGPPLKDSFMEFYEMDERQAEAAIEKYRERFSVTGLFENEIYPGVERMLRTLSGKGFCLAVASSKPTVYVERILEHFGIRQYFKVVVGSELDGRRTDKGQVVTETLRQLFGDQPVRCDEVYMVGDRKFDVEGAHAMGVESVGVAYGYGGVGELRDAHADYIVESVEELQALLLRELCETQPGGLGGVIRTLLFPFLLFMIVRLAAYSGAMYLAAAAGLNSTGDLGAIVRAFSYAVAGTALLPAALPVIRKAKGRMALGHLRRERPRNYFLALLVIVCAVLALNLLFDLTGLIGRSASYQAVAENQLNAALALGLLCYGVVTPLAEELLFRGILYNELRRRYRRTLAMASSALLFGLYHMNPIQGAYGFLMGLLMAYLYEYFGSFLWPLLVHMLANILAYALGCVDLTDSFIHSWPAAVVCAALAILGIKLLDSDKRKIKGPIVE